MKNKNCILKWAVVLTVLLLIPSSAIVNANEKESSTYENQIVILDTISKESLSYEEHIAILDTLPQ